MALALPAGIVQGLFPQGQMQATSAPFQWGSGGRRLTPEDIARERKIAAGMMQSDYSPVQHWTQGLGRVADNVLGALRDRDADKAAAENQAYSRSVAELLSNPGGTPSASAPPGSPQSSGSGGNLPQLMQIVADPYVDAGTKAIAQMQLEQAQKMLLKQFEYANREQPEIVQLAQIANDPTRPGWERSAAQAAIDAKNDPFVNIIGNEQFGSYSGRQSGLSALLGAQGGATGTPAPGTIVADPRKQDGGAPSVSSAPPPPDAAAMAQARAEADAWMKLNGMSR